VRETLYLNWLSTFHGELNPRAKERIAMIRVFFVCLSATSLFGCTSQTVQYAYKSSTTVAQKDKDALECEVLASRTVGQNVQIGTTPTYTTPIQTNCYTIGNSVQCNTTGGQIFGGNTYSYDANAGLRSDVARQCLLDRGYTITPIPACPTSQTTPEIKQALNGQLQAPGPNACAVKISNRGSNALNRPE